jgi:tRNA U34 5-carboxymethylaminomethyl modifying enzyme MnmG/GidA
MGPAARSDDYDVAIVGAGGCGCEAALRLARGGYEVLLVTTSLDTVFAAHGERAPLAGPDDGLLSEIAAELDVAADGTVGAWELHGAAKYRLEAEPRVHLLQSSVDALLREGERVVGVDTWEGVPRRARAVALCVGPFLRARLRLGGHEEKAGRPGEMAYDELADDLAAAGIATVEAGYGGGGDGRPAWTVRFERLADDRVRDHRVHGTPGLYAAGICRTGPVGYPAAARDGAALAARIAHDLGPAQDPPKGQVT